ncbi:MAG: hypothetical protein JNJ58_08060 [Chitinophagaceae bacterium]|nr:hypothetical protein [Chitinophagaceae bacterium]
MPSDTKSILRKIPDWKQMLHTVGTRGIVANISFILYCAFLGLVYITLNHQAENTIRRINSTAKQLKEYRWKYIDQKSKLMFLTKESELEKGAISLGLEKTKVPPHKISIHLNRP